jgi:hypothetical protein
MDGNLIASYIHGILSSIQTKWWAILTVESVHAHVMSVENGIHINLVILSLLLVCFCGLPCFDCCGLMWDTSDLRILAAVGSFDHFVGMHTASCIGAR